MNKLPHERWQSKCYFTPVFTSVIEFKSPTEILQPLAYPLLHCQIRLSIWKCQSISQGSFPQQNLVLYCTGGQRCFTCELWELESSSQTARTHPGERQMLQVSDVAHAQRSFSWQYLYVPVPTAIIFSKCFSRGNNLTRRRESCFCVLD